MLKKYLKWIMLIIVLILGVVYYSFFRKKDDGVKYLTETVKRSDISQTIVASGTVRSNNRVEVGAQVSGKITKINVVLGQEVKKGDLLATIDSLTQNNNLDEAKSKLKVYQAQRKSASVKYQVAQSKFNRISKLYQMNSISQDDYESAKVDFEKSIVSSLNEIDTYYKSYQKANSSYALQEKNVKSQKEITKHYKNRYDNGNVEFKSWLEALVDEKDSELNLLKAKFDIIQAENKIYQAMGGKAK
ncbi:biotin/lipoyl-binding protein [Fusobacterium animalis]|uniref:TolC family protein n=1 Tax=Fusobacterium animalis TaxID=76859 RepID=UPI0030CB4587